MIQTELFHFLHRGLSAATAFAAADAEVVVVEDRVEQKRKAAVSFVAPHRVVCKHHDVAAADRNVDDRRLPCELRAAGKHTANEQFLFRSKS